MKKELRSRLKNSTVHNKPENQTKPSDKKQRRRAPKKSRLHKATTVTQDQSQPLEPRYQPIMKEDHQYCQTTTNTPCNINLEDYIDDINDHITQVDNFFHESIKRSLKEAGNIQITSEMRKILVRWLIKVARKFRVRSQTMHMCVQLIDYMLINKGTFFNKTNFQLLGVTCLFISCKYNEIYTIESEKYVEFCDGIYTIQQLFQMESQILMQIKFNLQLPNIHQFLSKIMLEFKIENEYQTLIKTLADMFMFDFNSFNSYRKNQLAIVIMYFTSKVYKLDQLKNYLCLYKNRIDPQIFKDCFLATMTLFKKSHLFNPNISI